MDMTDLKRLVGRTAGAALPSLGAEVTRGDLNSGGENRRRLKRWLAKDRILRLKQRGGDGDIEKMLIGRWTDAHIFEDFYDIHAERFEALFAGPHAVVLDWLAALVATRHIAELIEVGCGDGRALTKIAERLPDIPRLLGVDINDTIIARNTARHSNGRIAFLESDATAWLDENCRVGTLLVTIGGVMEYIAPATLERWFAALARARGTGVLLVEPLDPAHDLETTDDSLIHGGEDSFSHNYPALLTRAGLEIIEREDITFDGVRWMMILATTPQD